MTILGYTAQDSGAKSAVWTQLVDLLAQDNGRLSKEQAERAYQRLGELSDEVPERRKLASAASVASRIRSPDLVALFAANSPTVAAPVLLRSSLTGAQWASIIPRFPSSSRALLRERRDLPQEASIALSAYGLSDFALSDFAPSNSVQDDLDLGEFAVPQVESPADEMPTVLAPEGGAVPIGELVRRIEAFRERSKSDVHPAPGDLRASHFAFESDPAGLLCWVEGVPRAPVIGISLSEMAEANGLGVDGQASGAFRKRAPIRDARLTVLGSSDAGGEWLISAQPFFDSETGRFEGYRGVARRQSAVDLAGSAAFADGMSPGSIRQLVHELRTPLNAIRGFAEMIEGQFLGPVDQESRKRADAIIFESGRLLRVFEDLDISARLASNEELTMGNGESDVTRLLRQAAILQAPLADRRGVRLKVALPDSDARALIDEVAATRLLDRILLALLATAQRNELLSISLTIGETDVRIEADRPLALRNVSDNILLDPSVDHGNAVAEGDLPLGLAFVLRLIRKLARQVNGRFEMSPDSFILILARARVTTAGSIESI